MFSGSLPAAANSNELDSKPNHALAAGGAPAPASLAERVKEFFQVVEKSEYFEGIWDCRLFWKTLLVPAIKVQDMAFIKAVLDSPIMRSHDYLYTDRMATKGRAILKYLQDTMNPYSVPGSVKLYNFLPKLKAFIKEKKDELSGEVAVKAASSAAAAAGAGALDNFFAAAGGGGAQSSVAANSVNLSVAVARPYAPLPPLFPASSSSYYLNAYYPPQNLPVASASSSSSSAAAAAMPNPPPAVLPLYYQNPYYPAQNLPAVSASSSSSSAAAAAMPNPPPAVLPLYYQNRYYPAFNVPAASASSSSSSAAAAAVPNPPPVLLPSYYQNPYYPAQNLPAASASSSSSSAAAAMSYPPLPFNPAVVAANQQSVAAYKVLNNMRAALLDPLCLVEVKALFEPYMPVFVNSLTLREESVFNVNSQTKIEELELNKDKLFCLYKGIPVDVLKGIKASEVKLCDIEPSAIAMLPERVVRVTFDKIEMTSAHVEALKKTKITVVLIYPDTCSIALRSLPATIKLAGFRYFEEKMTGLVQSQGRYSYEDQLDALKGNNIFLAIRSCTPVDLIRKIGEKCKILLADILSIQQALALPEHVSEVILGPQTVESAVCILPPRIKISDITGVSAKVREVCEAYRPNDPYKQTASYKAMVAASPAVAKRKSQGVENTAVNVFKKLKPNLFSAWENLTAAALQVEAKLAEELNPLRTAILNRQGAYYLSFKNAWESEVLRFASKWDVSALAGAPSQFIQKIEKCAQDIIAAQNKRIRFNEDRIKEIGQELAEVNKLGSNSSAAAAANSVSVKTIPQKSIAALFSAELDTKKEKLRPGLFNALQDESNRLAIAVDTAVDHRIASLKAQLTIVEEEMAALKHFIELLSVLEGIGVDPITEDLLTDPAHIGNQYLFNYKTLTDWVEKSTAQNGKLVCPMTQVEFAKADIQKIPLATLAKVLAIRDSVVIAKKTLDVWLKGGEKKIQSNRDELALIESNQSSKMIAS